MPKIDIKIVSILWVRLKYIAKIYDYTILYYTIAAPASQAYVGRDDFDL